MLKSGRSDGDPMSQEEAEYLMDLLIEHAPQHTALDRFAADAPDAVNPPGESEPLRKLKYQYAVRQVIATYFHIHDMEVTARDLQQDLMGIVSDFTLESSQSDTESDVEEDSLNDERAPAEPFFPVAETVEELPLAQHTHSSSSRTRCSCSPQK